MRKYDGAQERTKEKERARAENEKTKNGARNATKKMFQDTPSSRRAYASPDNASPRRGRKVRFFRRGGKGTGCVVRGDGEKSSEINRRESRREGIRRNRTVGHVGGMPRDTGVA